MLTLVRTHTTIELYFRNTQYCRKEKLHKVKGSNLLENKWYFKIILYILTYMSTKINKLATTVYVQYMYSKLLELTCLGNHAPLDLYTVQM